MLFTSHEPSNAKEEICTKNNKKLPISLVDDVEEDLENLPAKLPRLLLKLCTWSNDRLHDGRTIMTTFAPELFGHQTKAVIFRRDIYAMVHMNEITASTIVFYMSHLHNVLKKAQMHESVIFVDPNDTYALGTQKTPTDWSRDLMDRFKMGNDDSIFLVPYNSGSHWTLTVVDVQNKKAYWLDPLKRRLPNTTEWTDVVNNGIKFYYAHKAPKKNIKIAVRWMPLLGMYVLGNVASEMSLTMKQPCTNFFQEWIMKPNHS